MMPFPGYTQMDQLNLLEGLSKGINNNSNNKLLEEDEIPESEQENQLEKNKRKMIFEDKDYGFNGGENFSSPPAARYSDKPLKYFGYDFFQNDPSSFTQLNNIPIPSGYLIGPGDNLKIIIYGTRNKQFTAEVTRDGSIFIPEIGLVSVAGQTFQQVRMNLKKTISNQIVGADVDISMGELRLINVFVVGEAYQPGMYNMGSLNSIINAIFISGGVNSSGTLRNIELKRDGKTITNFDFYEFLLKGDSSGNQRLMDGDVILINPISKTVGINGQIRRPGIYELKENETVKDLASFAGNLKPKADPYSAEISRIDTKRNGYNLIKIDLNEEKDNKQVLMNGDVLTIYPIFNSLNNAVLVQGHAQKPGFFPWYNGMKLSDLFKSSDDLLAMTDLGYILIKRVNKVNQDYQILQADLSEVFANPVTNENHILQDQDQIILLPKLLTPENITTKLITDQYIMDDEGNYVSKSEWTSMAYFRKSLMANNKFTTADDLDSNSLLPKSSQPKEEEIKKYFEYSIYDYCYLTEDFAINIIESSGYKAKKSIPLTELEGITDPKDFQQLINEIERESSKSGEALDLNQTLNERITSSCRRQLLDPIIELVNRQASLSTKKETFSIYGNVFFPGEYPLTKNMNITNATKSAGGIMEASSNSEIEITSRDLEGKRINVSNNFATESDPTSMNILLRPMDVINIKQIENQIKTVEITGEVFFPGIYPISDNQTISSLISRAGGLKDQASIIAANYTRESLKQLEAKRLKSAQDELKRKIILSSQSGGLGQGSQGTNMIDQLTELVTSDETAGGSALGRLVINLESILQGNNEDIILQHGDTLHIPKIQQVISVIGEVYVPNAHVYNDKNSIDHYINLSGGVNEFADDDNIYLIKANGNILSLSQVNRSGFFRNSSAGGIEPGDTIVVPLQTKPFSSLRATTEITQIIYQMALAAAAVNSF